MSRHHGLFGTWWDRQRRVWHQLGFLLLYIVVSVLLYVIYSTTDLGKMACPLMLILVFVPGMIFYWWLWRKGATKEKKKEY